MISDWDEPTGGGRRKRDVAFVMALSIRRVDAGWDDLIDCRDGLVGIRAQG